MSHYRESLLMLIIVHFFLDDEVMTHGVESGPCSNLFCLLHAGGS
jgi:hypothetical protein